MRLVAKNDAVGVAWQEFDIAMLALNTMYQRAEREGVSTAQASHHRMIKAQEVVHLWSAWRDLYLAGNGIHARDGVRS